MAVAMLTKRSPVIASEEQLITGEEFYAMGELGPCELVDGKIVTMSPPGMDHGEVEAALTEILRAFVRTHRLGRVASGEAGLFISRDPDTVRGVDIMFISHERYARRSTSAFLDVAPELIVEVLSPGNTMTEMMQKLREYFSIGVLLVWLVDPTVQSVYTYRSLTDLRVFTADDDLPGDTVLPGFEVRVITLFEM